MEVILLEKITKLGDPGDLVNVKSGYARNFLIPFSKAIKANEENKAEYEQRKSSVEKAELAFNQGKHFRWKFLKTICCGILKNLQLENVNVPTDESKENFYFKISFPCNTLRA